MRRFYLLLGCFPLAGAPAFASIATINASEDSEMREGTANGNFGTNTTLLIRSPAARPIIQFTQGSITGAIGGNTLVSATLELCIQSQNSLWNNGPNGAAGKPVHVHRVTQSWTEAAVTWNERITNVCWDGTSAPCMSATNGGTFVSPSDDSVNFSNGMDGCIQWDVTASVQHWIANPTQNFGLIVKHDPLFENDTGNVEFWSTEGTPTMGEHIPQLILDSQVPTPTLSPTTSPTITATSSPTETPTITPTSPPTHSPTETPTTTPTSSPTITPTFSPSPSPTPTPLCQQTPAACAHIPGKAGIGLSDDSNNAKDKLKWKWLKGDETLFSEFGDPLNSTQYALCIYDVNNLLVSESLIDPSATLWVPSGTTGFKYKDKNGTSAGITKITMKSGAAGKSKIIVKGKGANLDDPPPFPLLTPVASQFRNTVGGCWGATFDSPIKNEAGTFKGKEP